MKILCIGDVTSPGGIAHLEKTLRAFRKSHGVDLCVVNGENAAFVTGISPELADRLFLAGADVITGGNHTLRNKQAYTYLEDTDAILRPLNFGGEAPGHGSCVVTAGGKRVLVLSAMGNVHIDPVLDLPFSYIETALSRRAGEYDLAVLDIHAEATGEKLAVAYAFDGRISVVFGTHTHVQTADEQILPGGTGYISDVGMCGESGGILGMEPSLVVERIRTRLPSRFEAAKGAPCATGCIFTLEGTKCVAAERVKF